MRMKHLLILFILSFYFGITAKADNIPFIENGKTWHLRFYSPKAWMTHTFYEGPSDEYDLHFGKNESWLTQGEAEGDTVIAGYAYKKLYRGYGKDLSVAALLREEGGKVYQWDMDAEMERVLYDFTLNQGDVFYMPYQENGKEESYTCTVTKVDEYESAGHRLKRIHFDAQVPDGNGEDSNGGMSSNVWIEGLGVPNGNPLKSVIDPAQVGGRSCYCPYIYTPTVFYPFSFARQGFRGQELILYEEMPEVNSDGTSQKEQLQYELLTGNEEETDTLHISGYMWANADCNHYIYCYDDSKKVCWERVEIGQAKGSPKAYWVDVKFPMFYNEYYQYVVEDNEGEHPIGDVVNSISDIAEEGMFPTGIYDLIGRSVSTPTKGVFIQNGKKVMVK